MVSNVSVPQSTFSMTIYSTELGNPAVMTRSLRNTVFVVAAAQKGSDRKWRRPVTWHIVAPPIFTVPPPAAMPLMGCIQLVRNHKSICPSVG